MTDREKEIRDAERKALAEVRQWKRIAAKRNAAMTPEEREEHFQKMHAEWKAGKAALKAQGIHVIE